MSPSSAAPNHADAVKKALTARGRACAALARALDDAPLPAELSQYEKRFVALYELVTAQLHETKRLYAQHNVVADLASFAKKETSLLNSIRSQFLAATRTKEGKKGIVDALQRTLDGVNSTLSKQHLKCESEREVLRSLEARAAAEVGARRKYLADVRALQEELARGDVLRARADQMRRAHADAAAAR